MANTPVRVRFAPSPTGLMHLGNVRTALMNYLFARQRGGINILRIEDTDAQRNFDPEAKQIIADLTWLGIDYDEGPEQDGPHQPYFQSLRADNYLEHLHTLQDKKLIYRCFCTQEELEKKRIRQVALKLPPRYDKACLKLSPMDIEKKLQEKTPFIWRMMLDENKTIKIQDLARGTVTFNLQNFSDFPLTRQDGSCTFIFANFVDDMLMGITHVFRGEDHLSNTANQAALFQAFDCPLPIYCHLPMLFNLEGKKLSKRDFGFSLQDLKNAGFLPEALCNYLAIIGGGSFEQEIMSPDELIKTINFDKIHTTGQVRYDIEKLRWINHKWINNYNPKKLTEHCMPFLSAAYPQIKNLDTNKVTKLIQAVKTDLVTLVDVTQALDFYFEQPNFSAAARETTSENRSTIKALVFEHSSKIGNAKEFVDTLKQTASAQKIPLKHLFSFLRMSMTGRSSGPGVADIIDILGPEEAHRRIIQFLHHIVD